MLGRIVKNWFSEEVKPETAPPVLQGTVKLVVGIDSDDSYKAVIYYGQESPDAVTTIGRSEVIIGGHSDLEDVAHFAAGAVDRCRQRYPIDDFGFEVVHGEVNYVGFAPPVIPISEAISKEEAGYLTRLISEELEPETTFK